MTGLQLGLSSRRVGLPAIRLTQRTSICNAHLGQVLSGSRSPQLLGRTGRSDGCVTGLAVHRL